MTGKCLVCGQQVTQIVRVGHLLLAEPCAHQVLDLRQFDWFRRYERKHQTSKH